MLQSQEIQLPFLLANATLVRHEENQPDDASTRIREKEENSFHTRCGHPRARDD